MPPHSAVSKNSDFINFEDNLLACPVLTPDCLHRPLHNLEKPPISSFFDWRSVRWQQKSSATRFVPPLSRSWLHFHPKRPGVGSTELQPSPEICFTNWQDLTAFQEGPLCQFTVKSGPKEAIGQEALDQGFSNVPVLPPNLLAKTVLT